MSQEGSFRFFWSQDNLQFFKTCVRMSLIMPVLFCISCSSYRVASHDSQAINALSESQGKQATAAQPCKPISEGLYVVQAGAFKTLSYAQELRNSLDKKGYESYITVSGLSEEKRIFRVLIGRFLDRSQAQTLAEEIMKKEGREVIVAAKPPRDKYVVQAGCYANMEEARMQRKKLADYGYNPYITQSVSGSEKQYNVLLGEYLDRVEAEKACRQISEKANIPVFVNTM